MSEVGLPNDLVRAAVASAMEARERAVEEACRVILQAPSMPHGLKIEQGWVDKGSEGMRYECSLSWDETVPAHSWREVSPGGIIGNVSETEVPLHDTAAHLAAGGFGLASPDCKRCQLETQLGYAAPMRH